MSIEHDNPDPDGLLDILPFKSKQLADMCIKIGLGIMSYVILYFSAEREVLPFYAGVFISLAILFSLLTLMNRSIIELVSDTLGRLS